MNIDTNSANEYFSARLSSDIWFEQDNTKKLAAITTAKNKISKLPFIGTKAADNQAEVFPRYYKGKLLELPDDVAKAVFEEALSLLKQENNSFEDIPDGVQSLSLGGASISFNNAKSAFALSEQSARYLDGWLRKGFDIEPEKFKEVF